MNYYFIKYLPVRIKRFRASPLHELWQNKIVGQAGYGYGSLTVFEVTGFHRWELLNVLFPSICKSPELFMFIGYVSNSEGPFNI